jgi:hypothetical protein
MKRAATWLTRPRLTLIQTETSTKKTFTTFGYSLVDRHPHRLQRQPRHRVQHQHLRLRLRLRLQLHLHPRLQLRRHRHQDLLPLPGLFLRQGGDLRRGRDLEFAAISDREHLAAMSEIVCPAPACFAPRRRKYGGATSCEPRGSEDVRWASQSSALHDQRSFQARYQGSADTSRQLCGSGLGERQRSEGGSKKNRESLPVLNALTFQRL